MNNNTGKASQFNIRVADFRPMNSVGCRVCSIKNVMLMNISKIHLWELVAKVKLGNENERVRICYSCYRQLEELREFCMKPNSQKLMDHYWKPWEHNGH